MTRIRKFLARRSSLDPGWWAKAPKGMLPALDLGCGSFKTRDAYGADIRISSKADVICNFDKGFLPFKDNSFSLLYASHILEHVNNPENMLREIHRICRNEAYVLIRFPHFRSINAYSDVTHRRYLGFRALDNYIIGKGNITYYQWYKLIRRGVRLKRWLRRMGVELLMSILLPRVEGWVFLLPFMQFDIFFQLMVFKHSKTR